MHYFKFFFFPLILTLLFSSETKFSFGRTSFYILSTSSLITFNLFRAKQLYELSKSKIFSDIFFTVESMKVMHVLRSLLTLQSIHTCIADSVHLSAVINMASQMVNALSKAFSHHPIMSSFHNRAFDVCCSIMLPTAIIIWHQ